MKKILSMVVAFAMVLTLFSVVPALAAEPAPEAPAVLYANAVGGGDGLTAEAPMEFKAAQAAIADKGTIYITGENGDPEAWNNDIGVAGKTMSIIGIDDADGYQAILKTNANFRIIGNVTLDNIEFIKSQGEGYGFRIQDADSNLVLGSKVYMEQQFCYVNGASDLKYRVEINNGNFQQIDTIAYADTLSNVQSDIIFNGGYAYDIAVNHNWYGNAQKEATGRMNIEVNGGKVDYVVLGYTAPSPQVFHGTAKVTVNGGTVGGIYTNAWVGDWGSSGTRIIELNGGTVNAITEGGKNGGASYQVTLIYNNGMENKVAAPEGLARVITAAEGGKVTAVLDENNNFKGFDIITDMNTVMLDGAIISRNSAGLYDIPNGTHTVSYKNIEIKDAEKVYVSNTGDENSDGQSIDKPTTMAKAVKIVKDGGTIYIVGKVGTPDSWSYPIGSAEKAIVFEGATEDAAFVASAAFNLGGKVTFKNIAFEPVNPGESLFENRANSDVEFGAGVVFPTTGQLWYCPCADNINLKTTFNGPAFYPRVNLGGYYGTQQNVNHEVHVNQGTVDNMYVAHAWSRNWADGNHKFTGRYHVYVDGGTVNNIAIGTSYGSRLINADAQVVVNSGKVGTIKLNTQDFVPQGIRVAEINGGTVDSICGAVTQTAPTYLHRIVILNNGMADKVAVDATHIETVLKVAVGGTVKAVTPENGYYLEGYKITTDKAYVLVDGVPCYANDNGLYNISKGEHTIEFADEVVELDVRKNLWTMRANSLMNNKDAVFTAGADAMAAAMAQLNEAATDSDVTAAIAALKDAWNTVEYTVGEEAFKAHVAAYGDANDDGNINIIDLVAAKKDIAGVKAAAAFSVDMNDDNQNNADDLIAVRKVVLG